MLLRRLCSLTKSEAQVAQMVIRARGLKPIADELSVSVTIVKTHLRRIFDKTGTLTIGPCRSMAATPGGRQ